MDTLVAVEQKKDELRSAEKFFPKGAIAFFMLLVVMCLAIWFGIYFIMIERI